MKSNSSIQLFPTESSGVAPFFLIIGHEAAVKHTLLESGRPKYLGMDDGIINIELMTKLYHVVAHNLNGARKARDRNRKGKTSKEPEKLKIGDNVLIRDHTSKTFWPKYKDFCIVGLLGRNQVEIKDNHGHTTKVHCRDVKKIPMTEKNCQLYEEEKIGKGREGRKAVPSGRMPDLGWDIAETQLEEDCKQIEVQENSENYNPCTTLPLQAIIAIAIIITTILKNIIAYFREIPETTRMAAQAIKTTTIKISQNKLFKNITKSCKTAVLAVNIATSMTDHTNCRNQHHTTSRNTQNSPGTQKPNDEYDGSYKSHTSNTHNGIYN